MKTLLTFFVSLIIFSAQAQNNNPFDYGTIHFSATEINYGIVKKDSDGIRKLTITNIGKTALYINKCSATCGCTVPECPLEPLEPGRTGEMRIKYNTSKVGVFAKNVTVWSSDQVNPISIIKVYGEVIE